MRCTHLKVETIHTQTHKEKTERERELEAMLSCPIRAIGVEKELLKPGSGPKPKPAQNVTVHCTGFDKNNDLAIKFWSTKDPGQQPFTFQIGRGQVIEEISISKTHTHTHTMATITCVKQLAESPNLRSIPSNYAHSRAVNNASEPGDSIPIVDLSLLHSGNARAIQDLDNACQKWGFFMVVNHGIPEELMKGMLEATREFFNLPEDEKPEFQPKDVVSPIRYGTSFNTEKEHVFCWRDFLKVFVHPQFNCPDKPESLRKQLVEYCERCRDVTSKLLKGISISLGLEEGEAEAALGMASTQQIFAANLYPRCPNPDLAMGMPPHSDHGLFTLLIQNGVDGLQIQHDGRWINANPLPNSILVNTGDHLEIFSNGRYKSVMHRAVVNGEKTRISIAMANGPSREAVVVPAVQLVEAEGSAAAYVPSKYGDYILAQQSNQLNGKSILKSVKIGD